MTIFEGSAVALVLPMFDNGDIDFEGFKRQVQRMIDGGVQALLVNGTTGETATITIEDEFKLLDMTMELAKGTGVKVICGAGSNDTQTALKKARYAKEKGADAILVVTPYYNKTSQRGLIQHYTTIADAVDIPMILYNVPGRTGLNISVDTVVELAKHKNIQAMKDATDNIAYAMEVLAKTADLDFDLYSGCDDNILPFMAAGGKGVISVTSNLYPEAVEKLNQHRKTPQVNPCFRFIKYTYLMIFCQNCRNFNPLHLSARKRRVSFSVNIFFRAKTDTA